MEELTKREKQVLQLAASGLRVCDIARHLRVSVRTVEAHLSSSRQKLGSKNTTQAVVKSIRAGLIYSVAFVLSVNALSLNYDMEVRRPIRNFRVARLIKKREV